MVEAVSMADRWREDMEAGNQFRIVPEEESFIMEEMTRRFSRSDAEDFVMFATETGKLRAVAELIRENPDADVIELSELAESAPVDDPPVRELSY